LAILQRLHAAGVQGLVTRVSEEKAAAVLVAAQGGERRDSSQANEDNTEHHQPPSEAPLEIGHHAEARLLLCPPVTAASPAPEAAEVIVVCAGTSDRRVAIEAQLSLACHGIAAALVVDVGVAGLHRLLERLEQLKSARVLIACAGMEGALPTVLAGLLPQPVIAVPVSVGYGVSAGGVAALNGMLASCAPGLCVVNIDNGYGAAMAALRILNVQR
ncbi:MAG: nickel pincer cofactor biosynthesis protein LarB, partial [Cyanobacteriota bacterium]